jgi:uncharacterized protein YbbC (DUF1343 family)
MLRGVDLLVYDIQDVGARFYTYTCTMVYSMEEAARHGIGFIVLDRPNPITGVRVEPPMLDPELESFVGCLPIPVRHGMTAGELALLANGERRIGASLEVVPMEGWQRGDWFDSTGLPWVNPSPNIRSLNAALLYPGLALLEMAPDYSVGRGTDSPFEQIGAPWITGRTLSAYLNARRIPGVRTYPTKFHPDSGPAAGTEIEGVRFVITDRESFDSTQLGIEVAAALEHLYPGKADLEANRRLIGSWVAISSLRRGEEPSAVMDTLSEHRAVFLKTRDHYLLSHYQ